MDSEGIDSMEFPQDYEEAGDAGAGSLILVGASVPASSICRILSLYVLKVVPLCQCRWRIVLFQIVIHLTKLTTQLRSLVVIFWFCFGYFEINVLLFMFDEILFMFDEI